MTKLPWLPVILATGACAHGAIPAASPDVTALLRQQTQEMLDAIAIGDRAVWDRYLAPEVVYVSEAGDVEHRAQLLAELVPLPAGITGHIELGKFEVQLAGDTAIVFHADEETEDYFGHVLHAQYLNLAARYGRLEGDRPAGVCVADRPAGDRAACGAAR